MQGQAIDASGRTLSPAMDILVPAEFVTGYPSLNFDRDVLPQEFIGILEKEKRLIDVDIAIIVSITIPPLVFHPCPQS